MSNRSRPRPDELMDVNDDGNQLEDEDEMTEETNDQIYRPPRLLAVEYTRDHLSESAKAGKVLERQRRRLERSEVVKAMREEFSEAPEEIGGDWYMKSRETNALLRNERRREEYEEENLIRLPSTRKVKKDRQRLTHNLSSSMGEDSIKDLITFAEEAMDVGDDDPTIGKMKGAKRSALGAYLSAARHAKESASKAKEAQFGDLSVRFRDRGDTTTNSERAQPIKYNLGQLYGNDEETMGESNVVEKSKSMEKRAEKNELRKKKCAEKAQEFLPKMDEIVEGKRSTTRQIDKNRGLTRNRKKYSGHARLHNRIKFVNKLKKYNGVRSYVKKSVNLA